MENLTVKYQVSLISQMSFQNPWWTDTKKIYEDENVKKAKIIIPPLKSSLLSSHGQIPIIPLALFIVVIIGVVSFLVLIRKRKK